jgi:hypothetical protein
MEPTLFGPGVNAAPIKSATPAANGTYSLSFTLEDIKNFATTNYSGKSIHGMDVVAWEDTGDGKLNFPSSFTSTAMEHHVMSQKHLNRSPMGTLDYFSWDPATNKESFGELTAANSTGFNVDMGIKFNFLGQPSTP